MKKKRMFLVKREVMAVSAEQAIRSKGTVYCVEMANDILQPEEKKGTLGFKVKKGV